MWDYKLNDDFSDRDLEEVAEDMGEYLLTLRARLMGGMYEDYKHMNLDAINRLLDKLDLYHREKWIPEVLIKSIFTQFDCISSDFKEYETQQLS